MKKSEVLNAISYVLDTEVDESSNRESVSNWDSLAHVQIIIEIEERFGVEIPIEKVHDIWSAKDLLEFVGADKD